MIMLGSNMVVYRGEEFVLRCEVVNSLGQPYVLSNTLQNPYILIVVSSNTYRQRGRYIMRYWLDISDYPKFETVDIQHIPNLDKAPTEYGYPSNDFAVWYVVDAAGNTEYYYYDNGYKPYSFAFTKTFLSQDTAAWIESLYTYEINLVDGKTTLSYLKGYYEGLYPGQPVPDSALELWKAICKVKPELLKDIHIEAPLANFAIADVLRGPSKITIKANN